MSFKDTKQWHMGRRGEILVEAILADLGLSLIDLGGSTNSQAPFLHKKEFRLITPDAMSIRTAPAGIEIKTKSKHQRWKGGSAQDVNKVSERTEEGIDRANYDAYLRFQRDTRMTVVLFFLSIRDGELLCATLDDLGEPRRSPSPAWDLVNWDIRSMNRICTFDPKRLENYFYRKDGVFRPAPDDIPSQLELQKWLSRLEPSQGEFRVILEDIMGKIEAGWHRISRNREVR